MIKMQTLLADVAEPYVKGPRQDEILDLFSKFLDLLRTRTREANLTGFRDPSDLAIHVVGDALAPLQSPPEDFPEDGPSELLDVGSGAGIPGLVYAIYWSECNVTLLESNRKRVDFMKEAVDELGLENVTILEGRAESHAHELQWRERFDMVTTRALAPLPISLELCLPFLALDGHMLSFKGTSPAEEIKEADFALNKLGGGSIISKSYSPGNGAAKRHALWIPKVGLTPDRYPRREGIPAKRPLRGSR